MSFELFGKKQFKGLGTIEDPYYGDFDFIIGNAPVASDNIVLGRGTFYSKGGVSLKPGTILKGDYQFATTIKLVETGITDDITMIIGNGTVSELIIDCSVITQPPVPQKRNGIYLTGDNCKISRVMLQNCYGILQNEECFGLMIASGSNGVIEDCIVNQIKGNYTSAIAGCNGGIIQNNIAQFPDGYQGFGAGINIGGFNGCTIKNNLIINAIAGIYADWEWTKNSVIKNNTLRYCARGVLLNYQSSQQMDSATRGGASNILIQDNTIYLPNKDSMGIFLDTTETPFGSWIPTCGFIENIRIVENKILSHYPGLNREAVVLATRSNYLTSKSGIAGIYIIDNYLEGDIKYRMVGKDKIKGVTLENFKNGVREELIWI